MSDSFVPSVIETVFFDLVFEIDWWKILFYVLVCSFMNAELLSDLNRELTRASIRANPEIDVPVVPVVPIVAPVVTQARRKPRRFCQN